MFDSCTRELGRNWTMKGSSLWMSATRKVFVSP
jgi:hypothetical protein